MTIIPNISPTGSLGLIGTLCIIEAGTLFATKSGHLTRPVEEKGSFIWTLCLAIFYTWWIGARPYSGYGDTLAYYLGYQQALEEGAGEIVFNAGAEWLWGLFTLISVKSGFDYHGYFTLIAAAYMFTATWALKKFVPTSPYLGFLFMVSSLFFLTFGVNGLRNGVACHMIMLAMAFLMEDKRIIAGVIAFLSLGIHRSTMLPIASVIAALTVIRQPRYALHIWLASVPLSLMFGTQFTGLVAGAGLDDRMSAYAEGYDDGEYLNAGFRWDFLIYSCMGVGMIWYVTMVKKLRDGWYNIISITYLLANAVWVMMIRIEYSNRFAYLSWFLMPVVVVYPLCNMKIWSTGQERKTAMILLGYWAFSEIMYTFVWFH